MKRPNSREEKIEGKDWSKEEKVQPSTNWICTLLIKAPSQAKPGYIANAQPLISTHHHITFLPTNMDDGRAEWLCEQILQNYEEDESLKDETVSLSFYFLACTAVRCRGNSSILSEQRGGTSWCILTRWTNNLFKCERSPFTWIQVSKHHHRQNVKRKAKNALGFIKILLR